MSNFIRAEFDFDIPEELAESIDNLEKAVLENSTLLDCYLEELRQTAHGCVDAGLTEDEADEVIDYYYRRRYLNG